MDTVSLEVAFSRLGPGIQRGQRPLCATAQDGSLVLVCQSSGFSRPGAGVLRYSAKLSLVAAGRSYIEVLRAGLGSASTAGTSVRLIIQTQSENGASSRIHTRADLVGNVTAFDGDAFSVDFMRIVVEEPEPAPRRRKR